MARLKRELNYFKYNQCKSMEKKLEEYALKGLILEKITKNFWCYKKDEPKKLKYAITFFSEGSMFNYEPTENQKTYYEFAKECGWDLVAEINTMQVFSNESENPVPFDTDETQKLENIKKCTWKSFISSYIILLLVCLLNLGIQYSSFKRSPIDYLSDYTSMYPSIILIPTIIYLSHFMIEYLIWYKQSKKSIDLGGKCIEKDFKHGDLREKCFSWFIYICIGLYLIGLFKNSNIIIVILCCLHIPVLVFLAPKVTKFMKKKKQSATKNKVVNFAVIMLGSILYVGLMSFLSIKI